MALKEMLPYREEIIAMKEPPNVRTHDEVIDHLTSAYGITVSKPTVTRFLRLHAPHLVNSRKLTPEEERAVVPYEAFLRVESEIVAMREELGIQVDTLTERTGGKLAVLSADIVELEKAVMKLQQGQNLSHTATPAMVQSEVLRKIWFRAFVVCAIICGGIFTIALMMWRG